jgi:hypothetical protein
MQYSIVEFSKLKDITSFRFDAEFFHPEVLLYEERINKLHGKTVKEYGCEVVSGPFGSSLRSESYLASGIPFIRISDLKDFLIDDNKLTYISEEDHARLSSSRLQVGDLVLSKVGNIGVVSIVTDQIGECNISENNIGIRFPEWCSIEEKRFILTFLNSKPGQTQILRAISGNVQPKLNVSDVEFIKIPHMQPSLIKSISEVVNKAALFIDHSKQFYKEAEKLILSELNLLNWKPEHKLSFIRNFSDTQSADRIDAEYHQPMYEEVEHILSQRDRKTLESICSHINYGTVPTSPYVENGTPYIKGLNLIDGFIQGKLDFLTNTEKLPRKFYTKEHDIIISQMGTVGKAGLVMKEQENWLFASFTIRIRLKDHDFINPYVLTLYINRIAREWYLMRKIAQASVRQNTDLPTIKNLQVPKITKDIQDGIASKMAQSYKLKANSKNLLDIAKRGVEMAIEKSEEDACSRIDTQLDNK